MKKGISFVIIVLLLVLSFFYVKYENENVVAIIGAMDCEISELGAAVKGLNVQKHSDFTVLKGKIGKYNVVVTKSGVGKVNAGSTAQYIIDKYNPKYIVNIGLAGSLDKGVYQGDILVANKMVQHDFDISAFGYAKGYMSTGKDKHKPTVYYADTQLSQIFKKKLEANKNIKHVYEGMIATGDCFVSSAKNKGSIKEYFGANAVDMESAAIAQVAQKNNIPVVIIKNISDTKNDDAEEYAKKEDFYGKELAKTVSKMLESDKRF